MIPVAPARRPGRKDDRSVPHAGLVALLGFVLIVADLVLGFMASWPFDYTDSRPSPALALTIGAGAAVVVCLCVLGITYLVTAGSKPSLTHARRLGRAGLWSLGALVCATVLVGGAHLAVGRQVKSNQQGVHAWGSDVEWADTHIDVREPEFLHPARVPAEADLMLDEQQPSTRPLPAGTKLARVEWTWHNEDHRNGGSFWFADVIGPFLTVDAGTEQDALPDTTDDCAAYVSGSTAMRPRRGDSGVRAACWLVPEDASADDLVVRLGPGPNDVEWARWGSSRG